MDDSLLRIVHGFESLWGDAVEARCFPLLEFGDGPFDFVECDWDVYVGETQFLGDEVKYGVVNWAVVVEYFVEMHAEDRHIFFRVGSKIAVVKFHGHVDGGFVVSRFASGE